MYKMYIFQSFISVYCENLISFMPSLSNLPPCMVGRLRQRVYGLQIELLKVLIHLKFTLPQQMNFPKTSIGGVQI